MRSPLDGADWWRHHLIPATAGGSQPSWRARKALAGLLLVVAPGGGHGLDAVGVALAVTAMLGCAGYYVIAARPPDGLPPVALAAVVGVLATALAACSRPRSPTRPASRPPACSARG
ncbi:hypothetical protein ACPPVW_06625 [Leifsonia sp. McL0607]|uniref:hypothetical protein n=1 Tax=Leifsonia sp. McL0607 TaxID=3415672 RepID=UPI003CFBB8F6